MPLFQISHPKWANIMQLGTWSHPVDYRSIWVQKLKEKSSLYYLVTKNKNRHLLKYEDIFKTSTFLKYNYFYSINMISLQMGELCLSCNICELNIFTLDCYFYTPAK